MALRQETLKFSIIVPVYKVEPYIRVCLDSLLSQTYRNLEIILVDDGSPDACGAICDQYAAADARIKVIHKANGGLASARKAGAAVCTGDYVLNVDSDDYIAPDLTAKLFEIIAQYHPQIVTYDGFSFCDDGQTPFGGTMPVGFYAGSKMEEFQNQLICGAGYEVMIGYTIWSKAIQRDLYVQYQLDVPDAIYMGEDLAMTGPLFAHCESVYVSGIQGYYYRNNPQSIMNTFREDEARQIVLMAGWLKERMGSRYESKIHAYVLLRYYDFLDRAICLKSYHDYKKLIQETADEVILDSIQRAPHLPTYFTRRLAFFLMRHKCYTFLWILRHIKKRKR